MRFRAEITKKLSFNFFDVSLAISRRASGRRFLNDFLKDVMKNTMKNTPRISVPSAPKRLATEMLRSVPSGCLKFQIPNQAASAADR